MAYGLSFKLNMGDWAHGWPLQMWLEETQVVWYGCPFPPASGQLDASSMGIWEIGMTL